MELNHQLRPKLKQLRLSGVLSRLEARHRQALDRQWSYIEFVERLLEDEVERRAQKQLALRLGRGALNTTKTLEGFDFSFNPSINRQQILQLASCDYIRRKHNVLICGPSGVGKPQPYNYLLQYERFPTVTPHATPCDTASTSHSRT